MRYEEFIKSIMDGYVKKTKVGTEEFPDMELYMDQAALFMNKKLSAYEKNEKEPVFTKGMIANYVKHDMLPRPVNKRYTKDHLALLTLIFYLKSTLQVQEIESLMKPLIDNYNSEFEEKYDFLKLYTGINQIFDQKRESIAASIYEDVDKVKELLSQEEYADDDTSELFMLICILAMKADAQKFLAQKLLEEYFEEDKAKKK